LFGLKGQELLIILVIVLLIFGAKKLPDLARSLGSSAKEFRKGIEEGSAEDGVDDQAANAEASDADPSDSDPTP
jgi:sec-independent protein translocase protein TatA